MQFLRQIQSIHRFYTRNLVTKYFFYFVSLQMSNEMVKLSKKIDDRIVIEKAKGLLMARDHLSEPEAFKRIRTISMQKRVPMIEIAKLLVLQDDV